MITISEGKLKSLENVSNAKGVISAAAMDQRAAPADRVARSSAGVGDAASRGLRRPDEDGAAHRSGGEHAVDDDNRSLTDSPICPRFGGVSPEPSAIALGKRRRLPWAKELEKGVLGVPALVQSLRCQSAG